MENRSQGSDDVVVNVPRIQRKLDTAGDPLSNYCCIYKVPPRLRDINKDAYTPKIVSIGPFHHGSPSLQNAEREKRIFLRKFIDRSDKNLESLARFVEERVLRVRDYYSQKFELTDPQLVEIILVDAGFILELFILCGMGGRNSNERLSLSSWSLEDVIMDLLLLENQLPFSILHETFEFVRPAYVEKSLLELTFMMFGGCNLQGIDRHTVAVHGGPLHFNDLLRTFYLQPESYRPGRQEKDIELLYTVTELHEAGLKFKASKSRCLLDLKFSSESRCLLDLKFSSESRCLLDLKSSGRVLEIPILEVQDSTELLFRNMLALEQCHYPDECYIADYVMIVDYLINKESDVDVLVKKKIVRNWLGENNDVAKLFNGLGKNIAHGNLNSNYRDLCDNLNTFGGKPWRITRATFRRRYCKTPWHTAGSVAASLLLIFTVTQTVCSLYQVIHGD